MDEVRSAWASLKDEFGPCSYPPDSWFDYKQTAITSFVATMGSATFDHRPLAICEELRQCSMNSVWPVPLIWDRLFLLKS